jgi:hypothetical protein
MGLNRVAGLSALGHSAKLGSEHTPTALQVIRPQIRLHQTANPEGGLGLAGWRDFKKRSV